MSENLDQPELTARLEQTQPLRELAHTWYELSVACRHIGAMMERTAKEILYAPSSDSGQPSANEVNDNE